MFQDPCLYVRWCCVSFFRPRLGPVSGLNRPTVSFAPPPRVGVRPRLKENRVEVEIPTLNKSVGYPPGHRTDYGPIKTRSKNDGVHLPRRCDTGQTGQSTIVRSRGRRRTVLQGNKARPSLRVRITICTLGRDASERFRPREWHAAQCATKRKRDRRRVEYFHRGR